MLYVTAVHTFAAEHGDELEFEAGDRIEVLEKDDAFGDGWWRVSHFGLAVSVERSGSAGMMRRRGIRKWTHKERVSPVSGASP